MAFEVRIRINLNTIKTLSVASSSEEFENLTIRQLKEKSLSVFPGVNDPEDLSVVFGQNQLEDKDTFKSCNIEHLSLLIIVLKMHRGGGGYTGLENQGATDYLNTVLQILYMTEEFRDAVESVLKKNPGSTFNKLIAELFEHLDSRDRKPATTVGITTELQINVHKQEDAAKCLQKILNKVDPEISQVFHGKLAQTTICINPATAHEPLKQVKPFFIISISLDSEPAVDMQKCFDSYFAPITMSGEDQQVYCKQCEKMLDTQIVSSLQEAPPVLVLHLERFEFDYDSMCCVKNESSVHIPLRLRVKEVSGEHRSSYFTYELYAIANHVGSLSGGHYYADVRDVEEQWYRFDDSSVYISPLKEQILSDNLVSDEAYLLLYRKYQRRVKRAHSSKEDHYKKRHGQNDDSESLQTNHRDAH